METNNMDREETLDALYAQMKYAMDKECTWNVRNDAWREIDVLLDHFNILLAQEVEVVV